MRELSSSAPELQVALTTAAIVGALAVIAIGLTLWLIGREQGYRIGRAEIDDELGRSSPELDVDILRTPDPDESVRVVHYPEVVWPKGYRP
jgi:hypothetical protein